MALPPKRSKSAPITGPVMPSANMKTEYSEAVTPLPQPNSSSSGP